MLSLGGHRKSYQDTLDYGTAVTMQHGQSPPASTTLSEMVANNTTSFAQHASDLQRTGMAQNMAAVRQNRQNCKVIGTSQHNKRVKSVQTVRTVDIFVSRLQPQTAEAEPTDCVNEMKGDLSVLDVSCTRLKSRYEDLYKSMHVAIKVDAIDLQKAIYLFMLAESWPAGLFISRYPQKTWTTKR